MKYLEDLYSVLLDEGMPDTPELRENRKIFAALLDKVEAAMGQEISEKIGDIYGELSWMENEYYFRCGLRFGLELLRL